MNKIKKLLIAGGDLRQIYCAERLKKSYDVYIIGIDKKFIPENVFIPEATASMIEEFDCVVLPVQPPDENGSIVTPLFSRELNVTELQQLLKNDAVIFSGLSSPRLSDFFPKRKIFPYMEQEELTIRNAVATAEGAVMTALQELPVTLNGTSVLIVGAGRIGASLAIILKGFGASVTAAVRNSRGAAKAELLGISHIQSDNMGGDFRLVFNTVPKLLFTKDVTEKFPKDTLFIDLASRPGGFAQDAVKALGQRFMWELGIPGKTAPVTSGEAEADTIADLLENAGERRTAYD